MIHQEIIIIFLFLSVQIMESKEIDFFKYYSEIQLVQPPLTFSCNKDTSLKFIKNIDTVLSNQFKPAMAQMACRIWPNESFISIIYGFPSDDETPTLITYTKNGKVIDTLCLYREGCQGDQSFSENSTVFISSDKKIILQDTLVTLKLDDKGNQISGSESTLVSEANYIVNNVGQIIKTSEK